MKSAPEIESETVLRLMGFLIRSVRKEAAKELGALGMNQMDFMVLKMLSDRSLPPVTIASELGVSRAAVTQVTRKLEGEDLVRREQVKDDRRIALFRLTEKGASALRSAQRVYHACLMRRLGRVSAEDIVVLRRLLEKVVEA
jgi:DNA-binding MarR family transcriptional regulator